MSVIKLRKVSAFLYCFVLWQGRSHHVKEQERENSQKTLFLGAK